MAPDLSPLLNPSSIAVVGASERDGSPGRIVLENLRRLDYHGVVYPINPNHDTILGMPCYPDLHSLPGPVDAVAVLLSAEHVLPILRSAVAIGARAAWALAVGFAEGGVEGERRQAELAQLSRETGLLICGPNCVGVANLVDGVSMYSVALSSRNRPGGVSVISQSGAICMGLANAARFGFRYLISTGNEATLTAADYIHYLAGDPHTHVIVTFLEGIRTPVRFVVAAEAAAQAGKPILALKVGRSERARRAVQAHTGSLAGADAVVGAIFRRLGIVRLDTLDELIESAALFLTAPLPEGGGVAILSLSGGQVGLVADLAQEVGVCFAQLSGPARAALAQILPHTVVGNPLDVWGTGGRDGLYNTCMQIVSREPDVHVLAVTRDTPPGVAVEEVEQSLSEAETAVEIAQETGKPVLMFSNLSTGFQEDVKARLDEGRVPYLQGTRATLRAIKALVDYAAFQRARGLDQPRGCPSPAQLPDWRAMLSNRADALSEAEGRALLAAYNIPGPRETVARTAQEAVEAAGQIGYPVVLKVLSPDIQHKTEIGGVRIGLTDGPSVTAAFHDVVSASQRHHPEALLEGTLVQEMVPPGAVEVLLGILHDPDFGPVVVFGSGGTLVELLQDSSLRLPPLSREEAQEMIDETKGRRLLEGFRGQPPADVDALVNALVCVSQLAVDLGDRIAALDINPLMVLPAGQGVRAVDVLLEVRPE